MTIETKVIALQKDISYIKESMDEMKELLKEKNFVTRVEFNTMKWVGGICIAFVGFFFNYFKTK